METIKLTKFELIQAEKCTRKDKSIFIKDRTVFIIGRTKEGIKKIFFVNDFFPRFFVEKEENIEEVIKSHKNKIKEVKTIKDDEKYNYRNLGGEKELITIYTYTTDNVPDIRDFFSKHYEANIKFTEVFKRDKSIKGYFYVSDWIINSKERVYKIKGINYIMLFENEIHGGELIF